ncbi:MAG: DUF4242 domain-containing protein [Chloroflexi bacterium]|nr:MAG: DUF4242 domain-containing protein [Chloroflexota bacterium]
MGRTVHEADAQEGWKAPERYHGRSRLIKAGGGLMPTFMEKAGKVFCLAKGPNKEAVAAVHQKAGHPANELYEVNEGQ